MYDLTDKTVTGIMEYLLAEEEKWSSRKETKSSVKPITASKLAFPRASPKGKNAQETKDQENHADKKHTVLNSNEKKIYSSPLECWRCGNVGHRKDDCRNRRFWKSRIPRNYFHNPVINHRDTGNYINSELAKNKIEEVEKLTEDFKDVFLEEISELGSSDILPYDINLTITTPIRVKPYKLADILKKEVQKQ
ncbi:hypothetical protein AYI70_g6365 [Smittium culicis]|uniref:CCHC-type domain-containing protein n=1 Tax=Smittium culicis TaxID=133412 RepID=A0A1R1XQD7_9FUNG|nr:hypothetical protein AYI70_g6365 [Smittium culicis]